MTVQELLDLTNVLYPNAESTDNKVKFMNVALRSLSPYFGLTAEDDSLYTIADQDEYAFPYRAVRRVADYCSRRRKSCCAYQPL